MPIVPPLSLSAHCHRLGAALTSQPRPCTDTSCRVIAPGKGSHNLCRSRCRTTSVWRCDSYWHAPTQCVCCCIGQPQSQEHLGYCNNQVSRYQSTHHAYAPFFSASAPAPPPVPASTNGAAEALWSTTNSMTRAQDTVTAVEVKDCGPCTGTCKVIGCCSTNSVLSVQLSTGMLSTTAAVCSSRRSSMALT